MTPMNGLEVVERIRGHADAQIRATPIIMLTANGKEGTILKARKFGIAGYILKPISAKLLRERIEAVIKKKLRPPGATDAA
jgi:two-component system chemotaxis response regulator CheY